MPNDALSGQIHCVPVMIYDQEGNQQFTTLNLIGADETPATPNTSTITITPASPIKFAKLWNVSPTQTVYVAFGEAPAAGMRIALPPGGNIDVNVNSAVNMQYNSSASGGILSYVLMG